MRWSDEDARAFAADYGAGMSVKELGRKYGRSWEACRAKAAQLKLPARQDRRGGVMRPWTQEELRAAQNMSERGIGNVTIAKCLNRSKDSVRRKLGTHEDSVRPGGYWHLNRPRNQKASKQFAEAIDGHRFEDEPVKRGPMLSNWRLARVREVTA